jgi:tRNA(Ile)-lysidine synthase
VPDPSVAGRLDPCDLDDARFAALMAPLGPFEASPRLAVAVSGGPDSMALALLANRWAKVRSGEVVGLIVDHGLRPEAAAEARQTALWLAGRGIPHRILTWRGPKPSAGIQAAARAARYQLLTDWCRTAGVLHLLLAHHRDDQAETVALRRARGSGPDGLAAMATVREVAGLRLLRPLLPVAKSSLSALLAAEGQPWLDDPSNRQTNFARSRLRLQAELDRVGLAAVAFEHAACRTALDRVVAAWLAHHGRISAAGFVFMGRTELTAAPGEIARRALQQALIAVAGRGYAPRQARLDRLLEWLRGAPRLGGRTLGGCRILPRRARLLICREAGAIDHALDAAAGVWQTWDGRFAVRVVGDAASLYWGPLGEAGWRQRSCLHSLADPPEVPAPVRPGLPALWCGDRLLAVPPLALIAPSLAERLEIEVRFCPRQPLAGPLFHRPFF